MSTIQKRVGFYLLANACYGFYRGWNRLENTSRFQKPSHLYTERLLDGAFGMMTFGNPVFVPSTFIFGARRVEKWARGMEIITEDYEW